MTHNQALKLEKQLIKNRNNMIIVPDTKMALELQMVHGIPAHYIGVLSCVNPDTALIMTRAKYNKFLKMEGDIIAGVKNPD